MKEKKTWYFENIKKKKKKLKHLAWLNFLKKEGLNQ